MRLRTLVSHSPSVSAWLARPALSSSPPRACSMRATTASSASSEIDGLPRKALNCAFWRSSSRSRSALRSEREPTSMISNIVASA